MLKNRPLSQKNGELLSSILEKANISQRLCSINMGENDNEGEFSLDMGRHFYESLSANGRFGIHLRMLAGSNYHHILESSFKTFSRALREAASYDSRRIDSIPSTKGTL